MYLKSQMDSAHNKDSAYLLNLTDQVQKARL